LEDKLLNEKERWIQHYDLMLRPAHRAKITFHINDLVEPLEQRYESGNAVQLIDKDTAACRIVGFQIDSDNEALVLLIQHSDTKVSDPAFSKIQTGEVRVEPKLEGEGVAVSAHVVISLKEKAVGSSTFFLLLEEVPGLSKSKIERFLTHEFDVISNGRFSYKDKSGKEKPCRPLAELVAYPSDTLANGLATGELKEVQLIRTEVVSDGLDESSYIQEREYVTKIKIAPRLQLEAALRALQNIFTRAKSGNVQEMRVRIRQDTRSQVIPVDLTRSDVQNTLFIKANLLELDLPMAICEKHIKRDLVTKMIALLNGTSN
jgi:hypothetical protein